MFISRRLVPIVMVVLLMMATILAVPAFAAQGGPKRSAKSVDGAAVDGACEVGAGLSYTTIQSAVDDTSCETINVDPTQEYHENVTIDRDVKIYGSGAPDASPTFVFGSKEGSVFTVNAGSTVELAGFVIQDGGATQGGGIYNAGTLNMSDSYVSNNAAQENGGGIYNSGTLTLDNIDVDENVATGFGGGIYNAGTLTLTGGTLVFQNLAGIDGGGVYNDGRLSICYAYINNNQITGSGETNNFEGNSPEGCTTTSPVGSEPVVKGERYAVDHGGKGVSCLPGAAIKAHVEHGDRIVKRGC